ASRMVATVATFCRRPKANGTFVRVPGAKRARPLRPALAVRASALAVQTEQDAQAAPAPAAEAMLMRATAARTPVARARWARRGLASTAPRDKTPHSMLLRQLSLALYEQHRFEPAREAALDALKLGVMADVLHQDAARAAIASGQLDAAVAHLRIAARVGPASRRPFH